MLEDSRHPEKQGLERFKGRCPATWVFLLLATLLGGGVIGCILTELTQNAAWFPRSFAHMHLATGGQVRGLPSSLYSVQAL